MRQMAKPKYCIYEIYLTFIKSFFAKLTPELQFICCTTVITIIFFIFAVSQGWIISLSWDSALCLFHLLFISLWLEFWHIFPLVCGCQCINTNGKAYLCFFRLVLFSWNKWYIFPGVFAPFLSFLSMYFSFSRPPSLPHTVPCWLSYEPLLQTVNY